MPIRISSINDATLVTIDRPPVNALDFETVAELEDAFSSLVRSTPVGGVVLTGAGNVFSAGVDTRAFAGYGRQQRVDMVRAITRMVARLLAVPVPVVAAVNGHCLGGGFVLMLACDYRVAIDLDKVKLGMTEAQAGIPFPAGPVEIIRHELAPELLRRLTLTSAVLSPQDLREAGVIDQLCPPTELQTIAEGRVKALATQPAFRAIKRQIRGSLSDRVAELAASGQDPFLDAFL